jgi:hypothetical protein
VNKKLISTFVGLGAIAALVVGGSVANARATVQDIDGTRIQTGTVYHDQINDTVESDLMKTPANSVWTASLNKWSVTEEKLHPAVQQKLKFGTVADGAVYNTPVATIDKIGGSFATNATKLGSFKLTAGSWNLFFKERFERTVTGAAGTRMQLAIRDGSSGEDFGTDMGTEISPLKGRELVQSGVSYVTVDGDTTLDVYGFGYNDDQSAAGSGEITGKAQVWAELVG